MLRFVRSISPCLELDAAVFRKLPSVIVSSFLVLAVAIAMAGCGGTTGLPRAASVGSGVVSLDPQSWYILYSAQTADHPTAPPAAWNVSLPGTGGHLNYVQTSYRTNTRPQQIVVTFQVSESPDAIPVAFEAVASPCRDHDPCTPVAEFHVFFEQQGDDLSSEIGRWWYKPGFRLTNLPDDSYDAQTFVADGQPHTVTIPLSADQWTSVTGQGTASDFESALMNIGYVGVTFGGSDYFGGATVGQVAGR